MIDYANTLYKKIEDERSLRMSQSGDSVAGCIGYAVMAVAAVVLSVLVGAFVVAQLWSWFIVPLGASPISLAHAAGLNLFVAWFLSGIKHEDSGASKMKPGEKVAFLALKAVAMALLFLLFGAVIVSFMPATIQP